MGQYHQLYNKDKKEFVRAHHINNGSKLLEQVGFDLSTSTALFLLVANSNGRGGGDATPHPMIGRWAGDRVVVQGDYAKPTDPGFVPEDELAGYTDISTQVLDLLNNYDS